MSKLCSLHYSDEESHFKCLSSFLSDFYLYSKIMCCFSSVEFNEHIVNVYLHSFLRFETFGFVLSVYILF